ncbi:Down syndrome cell adhesion molecule-like protein 1 homolog [Eumeta japonica]|uniref:Down syndrome cell adhesion molecule-like protein 1 homolog n=1 Tax=Eumeta variegata TaxID=151549 RepID=A0A4C1ZF18_EUMVA|nr:Down syndrome cell adhesion molecule-like protein 1 homolog [Eumeta japonica]
MVVTEETVAGDTDAAAASDSRRICKTGGIDTTGFGFGGSGRQQWVFLGQCVTLTHQTISSVIPLLHRLDQTQSFKVKASSWRVETSGTSPLRGVREHDLFMSRLLVDDTVLSHTVRQLSVARVGSPVLLRCEMSSAGPVRGHLATRWTSAALGFSAPDSRWVSGAGGVLLGTALTQADLQAEYSCVVADVPSAAYKLATDDSGQCSSTHSSASRGSCGPPVLTGHVTAQAMTWQRQDANGEWNSITAADGTIGPGRCADGGAPQPRRYACAVSSDLSPRLLMRLVVHEPLSVTVCLTHCCRAPAAANCSVRGGRGAGVTLSWQHEGRSLHGTHDEVRRGARARAPRRRLPVHRARAYGFRRWIFGAHIGCKASITLVIEDCIITLNCLPIAPNAPLSDRPPRLVSTFGEAVARAGQSVTLRCAAVGVPPPRITWTLEDRPLPAASDK